MSAVLAACIRAEAAHGDITTAAISRRMRMPRHIAQDEISDLRDTDLVEETGASYNNEKTYRVTDAGYALSGVKRPFWMDAA